MRLISHDQKKKQCQMIVEFAKDWMNFVKNKCETGRGIRPRYFEFILILLNLNSSIVKGTAQWW